MAGVIDATTQCVRAGGQSWSFDVDLRSGVATLGGWRVRALRWGEKRRLARFATAGTAFLKRHFVSVCVNGAELPAEDAAEFDALWTLSQWMTTPEQSEPGLPLESTLLASVTLGLCTSLGWRPGDLDEMPASDVEAFWATTPGGEAAAEESTDASSEAGLPVGRAALTVRGLPGGAAPQRPRRSSSAGPAPGMSRIQIVPDPVSAEEAAVGTASERLPEAAESGSLGVSLPDGPRPRLARFRASVFDAQVRPTLDVVPAAPPVLEEDAFRVTDEELLKGLLPTPEQRESVEARRLTDGEFAPASPKFEPVMVGGANLMDGLTWISESPFSSRVQFASSEKASDAALFAREDDRAALFEDWAQQLQDAAEELGIDTSD